MQIKKWLNQVKDKITSSIDDKNSKDSESIQLMKKIKSDKFLKLAKSLSSGQGAKLDPSIDFGYYLKQNDHTITSLFQERLQSGKKIDICSDEMTEIIKKATTPPDNNAALFCIALVGFHHKRGSELEFIYPDLEGVRKVTPQLSAYIKDNLVSAGLPDAVHNAPEDYVYFLINIEDGKFPEVRSNSFLNSISHSEEKSGILYGISCFKQIAVTEEMRKINPELSRSHIQKAVCILSRVPLFGSLQAKLGATAKAYFEQTEFGSTNILEDIYETLNSSLNDINSNVSYGELFVGSSAKNLVRFLREKVLLLWKAIILEKRIIIYSQIPSACSNFIFSLLSLFPLCNDFKFSCKAQCYTENHYRDYGLPLRFFHSKSHIFPYFSLPFLNRVTKQTTFVAGTSNYILKTIPTLNYDIFLDLDKNIIEIKDENLKNLLNLCAAEKNWLKNIFKTLDQNKKAESKDMSWIDFQNIENEESLSFKGGEDWIRGEFHKYLKTLLVELDFFKALTTKKSESNPQSHKQLQEKIGEVKKKSAPFADSQNNILEGTDNNENSLEQISKKSKEQPEDTQEEIMVSEDDSVSREEIEAINDSIKLLKGYGIDWLLEWTKTPNFLFWLNNHNSQLHERSPNFGYTDNHFILSENGDIYVGEMVYGMKHGRGIFLERNKGFVYRGKWEYDKRNGEGSLTSLGTSDYLFDGEFKDNKKHGFGRLVTPHVKYAGHFVNDLFQGQGSLVDENQNIYEGEFREGLKEGMGKLFMKNGNEYAGEFKNGVYEGKGQLKIGKK